MLNRNKTPEAHRMFLVTHLLLDDEREWTNAEGNGRPTEMQQKLVEGTLRYQENGTVAVRDILWRDG